MGDTFLTAIEIQKVRHLQGITIPLSTEKRKHLILTGKNGSGKTSVLHALAAHFDYIIHDFQETNREKNRVNYWNKWVEAKTAENMLEQEKQAAKNEQQLWEYQMHHRTEGAVTFCTSLTDLREKYKNGRFILAYYRANRLSKVEVSSTIENVQLKDRYELDDTPGTKLVKYMVGLKATQAFAMQKGNQKRAAEIEDWFTRFEGVLKKIFDDSSVQLDFDVENFQFHILQDNREPFDFNTMSSGYSAVFDIINDLMMRMENQKNYAIEGIVLIDEIETHLHLELQRVILPILTGLFPNIQFIVTSHSPFVLSSIENAVIYDLETQQLVEDGLANFPYDSVVKGYFHADKLSVDFRKKLDQYKELIRKENLTDADYARIVELEQDLDEIPDYLSPDIAAEYSRMKLEFLNRG